MAPNSLIQLFFRSQLPRRQKSRVRVLPDGRKVLRGAAYQRRRRQVLERDGGRCAQCGSSYGVAVHHLRKRSLGRDDRMENLVSLCADCHNKEHQE